MCEKCSSRFRQRGKLSHHRKNCPREIMGMNDAINEIDNTSRVESTFVQPQPAPALGQPTSIVVPSYDGAVEE